MLKSEKKIKIWISLRCSVAEKEGERQTDTDLLIRFSNNWIDEAAAGWTQEPGTLSKCHMWMAEAQKAKVNLLLDEEICIILFINLASAEFIKSANSTQRGPKPSPTQWLTHSNSHSCKFIQVSYTGVLYCISSYDPHFYYALSMFRYA